MSNLIKFGHLTNPYVRDMFLSYLAYDARRTEPDGYPIIERHMVAKTPPKELFQWDCRHEVTNPGQSGMSFYCKDEGFTPILNNPHNYTEKLRSYACVIGMDASPYDNMPLVVQKSQIYTNLAITYYFGKNKLKVVPNVRLGNDKTIGMLDAIPRNCLIAIGTNGFIWRLDNRTSFQNQVAIVVDVLNPTGILVYGQVYDSVFKSAIDAGVPIYQYDSHTMKRNKEIKSLKKNCGDNNEG